MIQAQTGSGSCGAGSVSAHQVQLKELHIQQPMILFVDGGRLVRRNLMTGEDTLLSDHGFAMSPSAVRSADGRWLSYSGLTAGEQSTQYWLYDLQTDQDRLVLEHPAWGGSIPAISPDGRYLAIAANYDSRWPDSSAAGTYVFDTETLRPSRLGIPAEAPAASAWTLPEWSADGARLLLMTGPVHTTERIAKARQKERIEAQRAARTPVRASDATMSGPFWRAFPQG